MTRRLPMDAIHPGGPRARAMRRVRGGGPDDDGCRDMRMIRAIALLACLAGPVAAQDYGIPAVLAPCADRHMDAARYGTDLTARGWIFLPAGARADHLALLGETFVTMMAGEDGTWTDRIARARPIWAELGRSQMVFTSPDGDQTLMIGGARDADGAAQLRCWMAVSDGTRMDETYAQMLPEPGGAPTSGEEQVLVLTPAAATGQETFRIYLTRPAPGTDTPATHAGISTILTLAPGADE